MFHSLRTDRALEACQDAILGQQSWSDALQQLAEAFGAITSAILAVPNSGEVCGFFEQPSNAMFAFQAAWQEAYRGGVVDPHATIPLAMYHRHIPCLIDDDILTADDRATMPYFRELARPQDREHWADLTIRTPGRDWFVPFQRNARQGPFTRADAAELALLVPVLTRILARAERLAAANLTLRLDDLGGLHLAAWAIDAKGGVMFRNTAADAVCGADLWLGSGRLRAADPGNNAKLAAFINAAAQDPRGVEPVILLRDGVPWLLMDALAVTQRTMNVFTGAKAILLASPIVASAAPVGKILADAFGLTRAEARFAQVLTDGGGLAHAAATLGISRETARTHLGALFDKAGVRGQVPLVALLAQIAAVAKH